MATSAHALLLLRLSLLLTFLAISATARPCPHFHPYHTLIFFSSSSSHPLPRNPNPNFPPQNPTITFSGPRSVTFFFARPINPHPKPQIIVDRATTVDGENRPLPFGFDSSSFRDRTKDILSVVGSLLLGIVCGGLTAATLYLIYSVFAPNLFDSRGYGDDDESDDEDVGPKKMGYVAIPAAVKDVDVVAPAKEVV